MTESATTTLIICPMCKKESATVERRRQNTAYLEEESNWVTVCEDCFEEIQWQWEQMWRDLYGNIL